MASDRRAAYAEQDRQRAAEDAELQRTRAFNGLAAQMHAAVADMRERLRQMEKAATEEIERVLDHVASLARDIEDKSRAIGKMETVLRSAVADLEAETQTSLAKHAQALDAVATRVVSETIAKSQPRGVRKIVHRDENNRITSVTEEPIHD